MIQKIQKICAAHAALFVCPHPVHRVNRDGRGWFTRGTG
jgi:hypothetical protein